MFYIGTKATIFTILLLAEFIKLYKSDFSNQGHKIDFYYHTQAVIN